MAKEKAQAQKQEKGKQEAARPEAKAEKIKRWKGKDWFSILAPKGFKELHLAEIPALEAKSVIGRNIEIGVSELMDNPSKYHMKLRFKVTDVDGSVAHTRFNGFFVVQEAIARMARKKASKLESVEDVSTADGWGLHIKVVSTLNRKSYTQIQKKIRAEIVSTLRETVSKSSLEDLITSIVNGILQKNIKKAGSKIYPIRFTEVAKIEVLKVPAA